MFEDPRCEIYNIVLCENGGLLEETEKGFVCKCTENYYGENCTQSRCLKIVYLLHKISRQLEINNIFCIRSNVVGVAYVGGRQYQHGSNEKKNSRDVVVRYAVHFGIQVKNDLQL